MADTNKTNKYQEKYEVLAASKEIADIIQALSAIDDEIVAAKEDMSISDKKEVIEFVNWFTNEVSNEEIESEIHNRWVDYPECFKLASDYTLEGDLAVSRHIMMRFDPNTQAKLRQLIRYFKTFKQECLWNFWVGANDYYETFRPLDEKIDKDTEIYIYQVVRVWTIRTADMGGTILFRRILPDGTSIANGFVFQNGRFGAIKPDALKDVLVSGGGLNDKQLANMKFEEAKLD